MFPAVTIISNSRSALIYCLNVVIANRRRQPAPLTGILPVFTCWKSLIFFDKSFWYIPSFLSTYFVSSPPSFIFCHKAADCCRVGESSVKFGVWINRNKGKYGVATFDFLRNKLTKWGFFYFTIFHFQLLYFWRVFSIIV